ncbi:hypothetical protein AGOR_G00050220 [Albula goreensis]|uniref:Ig-like domain-containing protein n=1 Tax=Albula goreensis TaxID=1534307 RepID=A0A8T3E1M4_9TELE|nr:hypothetical protein AGOR_G00050220 [Albula goreensis]
MTQRTQVWLICACTAVTVQFVLALTSQYPKENDNESITCECTEKNCQAVFWYWHSLDSPGKFQFLLYHNNADKVVYSPSTSSDKYKGSKKEGTRTIYSLKISHVQKEDAGRYFCQVQYPNNRNLPGGTGVELRPGETPATPPPTPPPPKTNPPCRCRKKVIKKPITGCGHLVLWPLVGLLAGLAVVLIATLFYFSRLPKKCHHRFAKAKS